MLTWLTVVLVGRRRLEHVDLTGLERGHPLPGIRDRHHRELVEVRQLDAVLVLLPVLLPLLQHGALAGRLAEGESVELPLGDGSTVELRPVDVDLPQQTLEGWGVGSEGGITVALELDVTTELRREGLARDVVRVVQDARKTAGLDVSDRIALGIDAMGEVAEAMRDEGNRSRVAEETLATVLNDEPLPDATYSTEADLDGDAVTVTLRRA